MGVPTLTILAEVKDYEQLHAALRARVEQLDVSRETLDHLTGLQSGYCAKLLANTRLKRMGAQSLGPLLTVCGLRLLVVEDPDAMARFAPRLEKRDLRAVRVPTLGKRKKRRHYPKLGPAWGKRMAALRVLTQSRRERSRLASRAATIRWRDIKNAMRELKQKSNGRARG
jgi:hypothetical protein